MPLFSLATKKELAPFFNQRIAVQAVVSCFGKTPEGRHVIAVEQVHHDGQLIADHVWLPAENLYWLHLRHGEHIEFEGHVIRYVRKNHPNFFHYAFDTIRAARRIEGITL